jgi:endonuclease YncB( thermonuclease family)
MLGVVLSLSLLIPSSFIGLSNLQGTPVETLIVGVKADLDGTSSCQMKIDRIELRKGLNLISVGPVAGMTIQEFAEIFGGAVLAVVWIDPQTRRFKAYSPYTGNMLGETPMRSGMGYLVVARDEAAIQLDRSEIEGTADVMITHHAHRSQNDSSIETELVDLSEAIRMEGTVKEIYDGDTISVQLDDGSKEIIRLIGIDAPEMGDPDSYPEPFAPEAKSSLKKVKGKRVTLLLSSDDRYQRDDYGRLLCVVIHDGDNLNARLLREGLASRMFFRNSMLSFPAWEDLEVEARRAGRGIWSNLGSKGIVLSEINPNPGSVRDSQGEFVELRNLNPYPVNLGGWRLITPSREIELPEAIIPADGYLLLSRVDEATFRAVYPSVPAGVPIVRLKRLSLVNSYSPAEGLVLWLKDERGGIQDGLVYRLSWDGKGANGTDRTLERRCFDVINVGDSPIKGEDDANWDPSLAPFGTPGSSNSVKPPRIGDVSLNGEVTAYDASLILRHLFGYGHLYLIQIRSADMNGSGEVEIDDAALILKRIVGLWP